jgi:hypothetical protein
VDRLCGVDGLSEQDGDGGWADATGVQDLNPLLPKAIAAYGMFELGRWVVRCRTALAAAVREVSAPRRRSKDARCTSAEIDTWPDTHDVGLTRRARQRLEHVVTDWNL